MNLTFNGGAFMDEELGSTSVREQLINAGIAELEIHGVANFP